MNHELVQKWYLQAHGTRHYDGDPALDGNPPTVYWQGEASAGRFANLIVRECADLCDRLQARDVGMQPAECAGAIRKMFGVQK
jgi:hypothetical protein